VRFRGRCPSAFSGRSYRRRCTRSLVNRRQTSSSSPGVARAPPPMISPAPALQLVAGTIPGTCTGMPCAHALCSWCARRSCPRMHAKVSALLGRGHVLPERICCAAVPSELQTSSGSPHPVLVQADSVRGARHSCGAPFTVSPVVQRFHQVDVLGMPITDPGQAFTDLLMYMVPSATMPTVDIVPAITYLESTSGAHSPGQILSIAVANLKYQMDRLEWGFFDRVVRQEIFTA
jgi:hypothetical protein